MKQYINIIKGIVFFSLFFVILYFLSFIFVPKDNTEKAGILEERVYGILGEEKNTIDILILGDSEAYTSISPMELWKMKGFTSYTMGTNAQKLYESYNYLVEILKYQKPKLVILETNTFFRNLDNDEKIMNFFERYFPIFKYHNRWQNITIDDVINQPKYTYKTDLKGYGYYTETKPYKEAHPKYMYEKEDRFKLPKDDEYYIEKIYRKCKENDIELLLYTAPNIANWWYSKHNTVQDLADRFKVNYIDTNLIGEIGINWKVNTKDAGDHVNYSGAFKISKYLGNYIKDNYDIPNHKDDKKYDVWNEYLEKYNEIISDEEITRYFK